eukprot:gene35055-47101_t
MPTNAELIKQSKKYKMISMDSDEEAESSGFLNKSSKKKTKDKKDDIERSKEGNEKKPKDKLNGKFRVKSNDGKLGRDDHASSEEETTVIRKKSKLTGYEVGATSQNSGKDNDTDQQQMDNDLAERDAFVARLLEKEENRTRKEQKLDTAGGLSAAQVQELATRGVLSTNT